MEERSIRNYWSQLPSIQEQLRKPLLGLKCCECEQPVLDNPVRCFYCRDPLCGRPDCQKVEGNNIAVCASCHEAGEADEQHG